MQEMQETWVQSPGQEDPLEKEIVTHSSILAWEIPRTEEPGGLQSTGLQRVIYWAQKAVAQCVDYWGKQNLHYSCLENPMNSMKRQKELKSLLMKVKEESEKVCLKLNIQKMKIMASGPITSWQIDGETMETVIDFIVGAPKSLQMVTAAMKLRDTCSLEGKLWPT